MRLFRRGTSALAYELHFVHLHGLSWYHRSVAKFPIMQGGSEVIRHLNSRLPCICTFKQHLHCLIRWCRFGAGMRGDSIPSRVLIASQPQEGNEASLDFRAEGLAGFYLLILCGANANFLRSEENTTLAALLFAPS